MSNPGHHYEPVDGTSSSTPGLHFERSTSYEHYRPQSEGSSSRLASLDLTSTRDTYDTYDNWTELNEYPSSKRGDSDIKKSIEPRDRRASTASSASSNSTLVHQHRTVRWLEYVGAAVAAFWRLPIIRHIIWPFQWLSHHFSQLLVRSKFHGWRMGILLGSFMSSLILAVNVTVLVLGATRGSGFKGGFAVPMSGLAEDMSWWSSAIHIAINALSTTLLAASNYTMQVLSSPTRKDIDKAHAKHQWLDVGVLSTRNLSRIPRKRLLLFLIMGVSSIPIHLFYNSAVFYIGANNEYNLHVFQLESPGYQDIINRSNLGQIPANYDRPHYDVIDPDRWSKVYDTALVSYGDLYLAVDSFRSELENQTLTGFPFDYPEIPAQDLSNWAQGNVTFNLTTTLQHNSSSQDFVKELMDTNAVTKRWIRFDTMANGAIKDPPKFAHVIQGFAKRVDTASRIQLSLVFLIIVIVCNCAKLLTMLWVVTFERRDYVVTLGDGASSFLERPDPTTERMCILSKQEIIHEITDRSFQAKHDDHLSRLMFQHNKKWVKRFSTYSNALNKDRQIGSYFIFIVVGVLFASFLITVTTISVTSTGWGTKSTAAFRLADSSAQQTLLNAWIANAPQLVLSFCYLAINSECTAMAGAAEWNSLASSRKGLRVTRPYGQQRDTYFLQLPYRWSLPLTLASGGLHWLLSQSIFLVRIDTYDRNGNIITLEEDNKPKSRSACGFSGTSWIILTWSFLILVGVVGLIGRKKFKVRIPFAASSSLVISAACHPPAGDVEPHLKPVRWGVVEKLMYDGEAHCSLSARDVTKPKAGTKYL